MLFLRWVPSIVWMAVIFYLSSRTGSDLQGMFPFLDSFNFGHLIAYFILSLLFYWALQTKTGRRKLDVRLIAVGLSLLYGLTDEWHQSFVPSRSPDPIDILNDVIGASAAMLVVTWYSLRKKASSKL